MQRNNWIGTRCRDNFAYTLGQKPFYSKGCGNSLIISDSSKGEVKGINNHAIIFENGKNYQIPINNIEEIVNVSSEILNESRIFYEKPLSIFRRENLEHLANNEIKDMLFGNYGFRVNSIMEVETKKGKHRVYKLSCNEGEFMLKYRGNDFDFFDSQVKILNNTSYIPNIIKTKNGKFNSVLKGNIYSLERFFSGSKNPSDSSNYFNLLGNHISFMHNELSLPFKDSLEKKLFQEGIFFNESNIISSYIDLFFSKENEDLLKYFNSSLVHDFAKYMPNLPKQFIHGDLNKSNIIWRENSPTFVDSENIMFSRRLREFIPVLLFKGDLKYPFYKENSMKELIEGYQEASKDALKDIELNLFPKILEFSLIKLYNIYNIRRNRKDLNFKKQVLESLKLLGKENVH